MAPRITLAFVASTVLALSLTCTCLAREPQPPQQGAAATLTGIDTDRLSRAQLRVWRSILDIVTAVDKRGRHLYPTLYGLYRQADTSGHLIRIELSEEESLSRAGQFSIETLDPRGVRHLTTIRLNLATMRRTYVGEDARYSNGLMPFSGLGTKQRYAEVLGHELAHAVDVFQNAESLQLYQQLEREARDLDAGDVKDANCDRLKRLESVNQLMRQIERPAEAAELEIWRELRHGTALEMRISTAKRNDAGLGAFTLPNSLP
jgi:hypothetical protein